MILIADPAEELGQDLMVALDALRRVRRHDLLEADADPLEERMRPDRRQRAERVDAPVQQRVHARRRGYREDLLLLGTQQSDHPGQAEASDCDPRPAGERDATDREAVLVQFDVVGQRRPQEFDLPVLRGRRIALPARALVEGLQEPPHVGAPHHERAASKAEARGELPPVQLAVAEGQAALLVRSGQPITHLGNGLPGPAWLDIDGERIAA